jgi:hypothetical protein
MTTPTDLKKYTPRELPKFATAYDSNIDPTPRGTPPAEILDAAQRRARFPGAARHGVVG